MMSVATGCFANARVITGIKSRQLGVVQTSTVGFTITIGYFKLCWDWKKGLQQGQSGKFLVPYRQLSLFVLPILTEL
jgi:hypothetical protein